MSGSIYWLALGAAGLALLHLFQPFYRAQDGAAQAKGTGLGLAVAEGLVRAHGGKIRAEKRAEGGARLVVTLPLGEAPVAPAEQRA